VDKEYSLVAQLHTIDRIQRLAMKVKFADQKLVPGLQRTYNGDNFPAVKFKPKKAIKHAGYHTNTSSALGDPLNNFSAKTRSQTVQSNFSTYMKGLSYAEVMKADSMKQAIQMKMGNADIDPKTLKTLNNVASNQEIRILVPENISLGTSQKSRLESKRPTAYLERSYREPYQTQYAEDLHLVASTDLETITD
jgi:hypothetical protein